MNSQSAADWIRVASRSDIAVYITRIVAALELSALSFGDLSFRFQKCLKPKV